MSLADDVALVPNGSIGSDLQEWADRITGNKSDAKANFFMGVCSLSYSFLVMLLYLILNMYYEI